ncbi:MAG: secretin N-terminal domain-containing protein [Vicinamibacteria bacterium]
MTRPIGSSLLLCLLLVAAGCRTAADFKAGEVAERNGRFDEAVSYYTRAVKEDPNSSKYRNNLKRAKLRAAEAHALQATRHKNAGELDAAQRELQLAIAMNPTDTNLVQELARIDVAIQEKNATAALANIDRLKEQARETPLGRLELAPGGEEPAGFLFREARLRDVFLSLGKMAGVNMVFDGAFVDQTISIELHDTSFEEALRSLCQVSQNFFYVQSENIVTIVPDTPAKRREYEKQIMKTFYLSSADVKETIDLLRIVLGARRVAPHTATNALTIVDTPEKVAAAERIITTIDKSRAEVVVHLELLEVNRTSLEEYGIQLRSGIDGVEGITVGVFPEQSTTLDGSPYDGSNVSVSGLPGAVVQLLRMDGDTRILASPRLRMVDGQTAIAQFGERIPIPITTFTPIAQGGIAQQPITTFEYQNIGVNIEVTPRTHHNDEVSLQLRVQLDNISGTTLQGLPTFGNRFVETLLRLKDGETSLLAGLILTEERTSMTGIPGLASVPILGRLFAANKDEARETDIVLILTPRVVRRANLTLDDLRSYIVEGGTSGGLLYEPPVPAPRNPRSDNDEEKKP